MVRSSPETDVTVKFVAETAVPPGVVTEIFPEVAPAGTLVTMLVPLLTAKVEDTPLNFTEVAPVKFVPVRLTVIPTAPLAGAKPEIVGAGGGAVTVKLVAEEAVPPGVVMAMGPVAAPAGTVVVTCVALLTVKVAAVPLKVTAVAPLRFVPVMVTVDPARPLVGAKPVIVGAGGVTVKLAAEVAVPPAVTTLIFPLVAPAGTEVEIWVALPTTKVATVPLNLTLVVPVRFVPVMVTAMPVEPLLGEKLLMLGGGGGGVEGLVVPPPPQAIVTASKVLQAASSTGTRQA